MFKHITYFRNQYSLHLIMYCKIHVGTLMWIEDKGLSRWAQAFSFLDLLLLFDLKKSAFILRTICSYTTKST